MLHTSRQLTLPPTSRPSCGECTKGRSLSDCLRQGLDSLGVDMVATPCTRLCHSPRNPGSPSISKVGSGTHRAELSGLTLLSMSLGKNAKISWNTAWEHPAGESEPLCTHPGLLGSRPYPVHALEVQPVVGDSQGPSHGSRERADVRDIFG